MRRVCGQVPAAESREVDLQLNEFAYPLCDCGLYQFPGLCELVFIGGNRSESLPVWGALYGDGDGRDPGADVHERDEMIPTVPGIIYDGRIQDGDLLGGWG